MDPSEPYSESDISAVVCIRLHERNPWVLERLEKLGGYYERPPVFIIVDFGSPPAESGRIRAICGESGFRYLRIDDDGVFSLAEARNAGALLAETDLIYFTDIDFFSVPHHFTRLSEHASHHHFRRVRDIVLYVPAFHLGEEASRGFWNEPPAGRAGFLERTAAKAVENPPGSVAEFVVPYSNNFLCTRDFFMMCGGYDPAFRGHGSEDFELMIRIALHVGNVLLPADVKADKYRPKSEGFFKQRPYSGFRRLGEALAFRGETSGFKTFHLWHPVRQEDPWRVAKDDGRHRLEAALVKYLGRPAGLARVDHVAHGKSAVCLCEDPAGFASFLPFRALGYRVRLADSADDLTGADALMLACRGRVMTEGMREWVEKALSAGIEVIIATSREGGAAVEYHTAGGERLGIGSIRGTNPGAEDFRDRAVVRLEWKGKTLHLERAADIGRIDGGSYVNGRLGLGMRVTDDFKKRRGGRLRRIRRSIRRIVTGRSKR